MGLYVSKQPGTALEMEMAWHEFLGVPLDSEHWDSSLVKSPAYRARQKTKTRVKHGKKDSKTLQSALSSGYRTAEESGWKQGREMGPEETQASQIGRAHV